jgi:hypothetical protein
VGYIQITLREKERTVTIENYFPLAISAFRKIGAASLIDAAIEKWAKKKYPHFKIATRAPMPPRQAQLHLRGLSDKPTGIKTAHRKTSKYLLQMRREQQNLRRAHHK